MSLRHLEQPLDARFALERACAGGADTIGRTYDARDVVTGQEVSLQLVPAHADPVTRARVERTAIFTERLEGEHVLHVVDAGFLADGTLFVARERPLHTLAVEAEGHALALADAVAWVLEASEAVAEAHALGVAHGDVRAEDIFLARSDGDRPSAKLAFTTAMIEPAAPADRRADIAGLALLLGRLLVGHVDREGDAIRTLPGELSHVLTRAANCGYHDVAAFAEDLTPFAPPEHGSARTAAFLLARAGMLPPTTADVPAAVTATQAPPPPETIDKLASVRARSAAHGTAHAPVTQAAHAAQAAQAAHVRWGAAALTAAVVVLVFALRPSPEAPKASSGHDDSVGSTVHLTSATEPPAPVVDGSSPPDASIEAPEDAGQ